MIKIITFINKVKTKMSVMYYKRLFHELTGQDVSTAKFMGKVEVRNRNIVIGKNVSFRGDIILDGNGPIVIGDNVSINHGTMIFASKGGGVYIGKNTAIAAYSFIIDMNHGTAKGDNFHEQADTVAKITIGKNVWIAQNVTILKGSVIGDSAICAAKTVITGKLFLRMR